MQQNKPKSILKMPEPVPMQYVMDRMHAIEENKNHLNR